MEIKSPGPIPKEAINYFNNKVSVPGFDYRDIWKDEHAHSFTVAKAMQLDVLDSIRGALSKALSEGQTMRDFSKNLTPELQRLGWWGKSQMMDPLTGDVVPVQLGSPRRLKTIFNANMRTARAAGQWERAERTKKALPYMLYELGPSIEHRQEHVEWHGVCLPIDHPWFETHAPINGYGCKCRLRQVSRIEYERLKTNGVPAPDRKQEINPETGLPTGRMEKRTIPVKTTAPKTEYVEWKNKRTGTVELVPEGIDPGWDTNPGKVRQQNLESLLAGKVDGLKGPARTVAVRDLASSGRFSAWVDTVIARNEPIGEHQILGAIDDDIKEFVKTKNVELLTHVILMDDDVLLHSRDRKEQRKAAMSLDDMRVLPLKLLDAKCYWDGQKQSLIYAFDASDREGKLATSVVMVNWVRKKKKLKTTTNMIVTTGIVQPENLRDPKRYTEIIRKKTR
jgi:hypothetical protein